MSAHHYVNILALLYHIDVSLLPWVLLTVAYVRHHHHIISLLLLFQLTGKLICSLNSACISQTLDIIGVQKPFRIHVYTHKRHSFTTDANNVVWLEKLLHSWVRELIVSAKLGSLYTAVVLVEFQNTVVKLMVPKNYIIKPQRVKALVLNLSAKIVEERSTLHRIAGVNSNHILVRRPHAIQQRPLTQKSALAVCIWQHHAVSVIDAYYC